MEQRPDNGTVYLSTDVPGETVESMIRFGCVGGMSPSGVVTTSSS